MNICTGKVCSSHTVNHFKPKKCQEIRISDSSKSFLHLFESKFLTVLCTIELCLVSSRNKTSKSLLINSCNLNCMQICSDYGLPEIRVPKIRFLGINNKYPKYWVYKKRIKLFLDFFGNIFWGKYETFLSTAIFYLWSFIDLAKDEIKLYILQILNCVDLN